jgi:hypothetical protein
LDWFSGVKVTDVTTYASSVLVLSTAVVTACLLPLRRALRLDPVILFRDPAIRLHIYCRRCASAVDQVKAETVRDYSFPPSGAHIYTAAAAVQAAVRAFGNQYFLWPHTMRSSGLEISTETESWIWVVNLHPKYSWHPYRLLLSTRATGKELVGEAAIFETAN